MGQKTSKAEGVHPIQTGSFDEARESLKHIASGLEFDINAIAMIRARLVTPNAETWQLLLDASDKLARSARRLIDYARAANVQQEWISNAIKKRETTVRDTVCNDCGRKLGFYQKVNS